MLAFYLTKKTLNLFHKYFWTMCSVWISLQRLPLYMFLPPPAYFCWWEKKVIRGQNPPEKSLLCQYHEWRNLVDAAAKTCHKCQGKGFLPWKSIYLKKYHKCQAYYLGSADDAEQESTQNEWMRWSIQRNTCIESVRFRKEILPKRNNLFNP